MTISYLRFGCLVSSERARGFSQNKTDDNERLSEARHLGKKLRFVFCRCQYWRLLYCLWVRKWTANHETAASLKKKKARPKYRLLTGMLARTIPAATPKTILWKHPRDHLRFPEPCSSTLNPRCSHLNFWAMRQRWMDWKDSFERLLLSTGIPMVETSHGKTTPGWKI